LGRGNAGQAAAEASFARVRLVQPPCEALGAAVHLGQGRFVTAAHVVDGTPARLRGCVPGPVTPLVVFAGNATPARLLRAGRGDVGPEVGLRYLGGRDLALIQAGPRAEAGAEVCAADAATGQAVVVTTPWRTVRAQVLGSMRESPAAYGGYAEIGIRLEPGESGAGVFDAARGCLLGLVSHRDDATPERTRVVLASALRGFLAEQAP
jgi:hypothetical protein